MKLFNPFGIATFFSTFCLSVNVTPVYSENYVCLENDSSYQAKFYILWEDTGYGDGSKLQTASVGPFDPGKTKCIKMHMNLDMYEGDTYKTWVKAAKSYDTIPTISGSKTADCGDWAVKTGSGEKITWTATGLITTPICTD